MYNPDITDELRAIETALKARPEPTITGGQLFALIGSVAPELSIRELVGIPRGPGALTEFVRCHLTAMVERIGNAGGDILYRISGRDVGTLPLAASSDVWRTFVSPSSPKHIVLSRSARRLVTRDTTAVAAEDEVEVAKASSAEHDKMRADFTASLPESEAATLRDHVVSDTDFASWIAALRQYLPEAMRLWGHYRRRRLSQLFATRIDELALEESLQRAVLAQVKAAEVSAYERPKDGTAAVAKDVTRPIRSPEEATNTTSRARLLAHAAIDLLAYDELRALRLPLGVMLDAVRAES